MKFKLSTTFLKEKSLSAEEKNQLFFFCSFSSSSSSSCKKEKHLQFTKVKNLL